MRISIYLFTTSHTHLLLTTPTSHTHRFHPLSKIAIHTSVQYKSAEAWMTILESGWNLWVWLVGVVSRSCVWLVVKRYIDILTIIINFPYSTCIRSFFDSNILTSLFIFKMFFRSLESIDSMILILQWTYRDSILSSDARLHVNPIHFLAQRAVC